jgi:DNA-binding transcriptional ArsR family regulator
MWLADRDTGLRNRHVRIFCMNRPLLASTSDSVWAARARRQGDLLPCLYPATFFWRRNSMGTATLKVKKATKSAPAVNEKLLRTKTFQRAANLLKQVSDPTRLRVITLLSEGEHHVGGLCEEFSMSQPAVSHHLALLRHGGIVDRRRQGKNNFYTLTEAGYQLSKVIDGVIG